MSFDPIQTIGRTVSQALGRNSWLITQLRPAYEATLKAYHGDRGIPWEINGQVYRIDPAHRQLMGQNWDPEVASFLSKRLKPTALCLDVGANAGIYVLQLCRWAPSGKVIAFEPNPITQTILKNHIRMNGLQERASIVPLAVSDQEGVAEFHFSQASGMSRLGEANPELASSASCIKVKVTTLDIYCGEHHLEPDLLLMDIEGYEYNALKGARQLISSVPKIELVIEMHPAYWSSDLTAAKWTELFSSFGFTTVIPLSGQKDIYKDTGSIFLSR